MELNQAQNQAVEHTSSPLLLVAGPGSGKTRVIIERIVRLVNSGIKPDEILCLTLGGIVGRGMGDFVYLTVLYEDSSAMNSLKLLAHTFDARFDHLADGPRFL